MSFSYSAKGTRDEVVASLESLTPAQLGHERFAEAIEEAIVDAISVGTEMIDPSDQRYEVNVTGHSGQGSVVTLSATVKVVPFQAPPDAPLADTASSAESMATST